MSTLLLKILSPWKLPARKSSWSRYVRLYHWLLVRRLPKYRRSAISDVINLGSVRIIHNVRDFWYEQELQRFHIDVAQHLERHAQSYSLKQKSRRSKSFNWTESLLVFDGDKSYNIKRAKSLTIETDIEGLLKVSTAKDILLRSEFTAKSAPVRPMKVESEVNRPKQKINIKDTVPSPPPVQNKTTKHEGFEENDAF